MLKWSYFNTVCHERSGILIPGFPACLVLPCFLSKCPRCKTARVVGIFVVFERVRLRDPDYASTGVQPKIFFWCALFGVFSGVLYYAVRKHHGLKKKKK